MQDKVYMQRVKLDYMVSRDRDTLVHMTVSFVLCCVIFLYSTLISTLGLTRSLGLELVSRNIRVNCVCPGLVDTPMSRALSPEVRDALLAKFPRERIATPDEVAQGIIRLCADSSTEHMTGRVLERRTGKYFDFDYLKD